MIAAVNEKAAVAMIDASSMLISTYQSGVITSAQCGTSQNLTVAVVGYNQTAEKKHFVIQASLGTTWGNNGYIYIGMAAAPGICGLN